MKKIVLKIEHFPSEQIPDVLTEHGIFINYYAEEFFAHPRFSIDRSKETIVTIAFLQEIGLENGATLREIFTHISKTGLKACHVSTGCFFGWHGQINHRAITPLLAEHTFHRIRQSQCCLKSLNRMMISQRDCIFEM